MPGTNNAAAPEPVIKIVRISDDEITFNTSISNNATGSELDRRRRRGLQAPRSAENRVPAGQMRRSGILAVIWSERCWRPSQACLTLRADVRPAAARPLATGERIEPAQRSRCDRNRRRYE